MLCTCTKMLKREVISHYTFPFYNSLAVIVLLSPFIFIIPRFIPNLTLSMDSSIHIPYSENASIYLFVINTNTHNLSRSAIAYNTWGKDFTKYYPNSLIRFASPLDLPMEYDNQFIVFWDNSLKPIQNFLLIFIQGLHDFYFSTNLDWFIRTTEDCFVDIRKLGNFVKELSKYKNPRTDNVLKGHMLRSPVRINGTNFAFLKVTSGWIMSRAAAKHFIEHEEQYLKDFFADGQVKGDDVITFDMMKTMSIPPNEVESSAFLSLPIDEQSLMFFKYNEYSRVPQCVMRDDKYLLPDLTLKNVIFWHSDNEKFLTNIQGFRVLNSIPEWLNVQFEHSIGSVCKIENHPHKMVIKK